MSALDRLSRGLFCWMTFLVSPLGWFVRGRFIRRLEPERLDRGLVLILPGIEGRSFFNISILQGLVDAGAPYGLEVVDWTTGNKFLVLYHLRAWRRNLRVADKLAARVASYRQEYPGRPVWLIGHSGGGAMSLLTAQSLPDDVRVTGIVLLAAAVSPRYNLTGARSRVEQGIWSFSSLIDFLFVGLGTTLFGTCDGWHGPAAGMIGFYPSADETPETASATLPPFTQVPYSPRFMQQFHFGGHFGPAHRVFIAETVAPILLARGAASSE